MAEVALSIGGRSYRLACRDGEEDELRAAAGLLDARMTALVENLGTVAEARLLLMAALLVSGELIDRDRDGPSGSREPYTDAAALETLARRAELLADRLEKAADAA